MKAKKLIFLTLALLLPVAIFIFLKIFGENEFNVPLLHQDGSVATPGNCDFRYATPYAVPDSLIDNLDFNTRDSLYVFYFDASLHTALRRIATETRWQSVQIVDPASFPPGTDERIVRECILLMKPPASVALVDHNRRIRGYYDGSDRDEIDRLLVEIKIILKQY